MEATPTTIADLRRLINEPDDAAPFTDAVLAARLLGWDLSINSLAATIWREKAASYAGLVDVQEGSSNRKMSQLYGQALSMASGLEAGDTAIVSAGRATTTRRIERM